MDIENIMKKMGICPIGKHCGISKSRILHFVTTLMNVVRVAVRVNRNDILVLQYPVKYYSTICGIAHLKGVHIITFIHDLDCFRFKRCSAPKEIGRMNESDALIGCNPRVCQWLKDNGFVGHNKKRITVPLHIFDFLSDSKCIDRTQVVVQYRVIYAGQLALNKNRFLYSFGDYIHNFTVNVYGRGFDRQHAVNPDKFVLKGFMLPDELICNADGDFGLVWDGDSVDCCSGDWGEYLAINTPHKISLYIRCGLPVIIWRKAAMAEFVEKNGIGISIDSLSDINHIYESITQEKYATLCHNVQRVNNSISKGCFFSDAISEAMKSVKGIASRL